MSDDLKERLLSIPLLREPSPEEVKRNTLAAWKAVEPTLLSGLHPEIMRLSIPTLFVTVPMTDVDTAWLDCFDGKDPTGVANRIIEYGCQAIRMFPEGFFFKLDSRSPKDWGIVQYTAANVHDLPDHIFGSERMLDDLCVQRYHRDGIVLCFRQWVELGEEYRVFVKGRVIQGISRYAYREPAKREHTPEVISVVEQAAIRYLTAIALHFPMQDFVFDFGDTGNGPVLIEINPYGLSDPCLFGSYAEIGGVRV